MDRSWLGVSSLQCQQISSLFLCRYLFWLRRWRLSAGRFTGNPHLQPRQHQHGALDQPGHSWLHHIHHLLLVYTEWRQWGRPQAGWRHGPDTHRWVPLAGLGQHLSPSLFLLLGTSHWMHICLFCLHPGPGPTCCTQATGPLIPGLIYLYYFLELLLYCLLLLQPLPQLEFHMLFFHKGLYSCSWRKHANPSTSMFLSLSCKTELLNNILMGLTYKIGNFKVELHYFWTYLRKLSSLLPFSVIFI